MSIDIPRLLSELQNTDPSVRRRAAEALSEGDDRAIYPLIKALNDTNGGVQDAAMRSLIAIGGERVAYMVLPLLREDSYLRNTALIILRELGGTSVPLLYALLKDKDHDVRKFALDLMGEIKKDVDPSVLLPAFKDENPNVRAAAAKAVAALNYREGLPALIDALKDEEWVCFSALDAIGELKGEEAVKSIEKLLTRSSAAVRYAAIETLGNLGSDEVRNVLVRHLDKAEGDEKNSVIKSLLKVGITPEMRDLSGHLIGMLKDGDWDERFIALKGVSVLDCTDALPVIVELAGALDSLIPENEERITRLKDAAMTVHCDATLISLLDAGALKYRAKVFIIEILGDLKCRKAVPSLIACLNDVSRDLRRQAVLALGKIGDTSSAVKLIRVSKEDEDAHVRCAAIEALGNMRAKEAYVTLKELLTLEKYDNVIETVVAALIKIDRVTFLSGVSGYNENILEAVAKTAVDEGMLLQLAGMGYKKVKIAAVKGLGKCGTDAALAAIVRFCGDADAEVRKAAMIGLGEARFSSDVLFTCLRDPDMWVRFYAIKAVSASCDREMIIERLTPLLNDEFVPVIMAAIDAIREAGGREAYDALSAHAGHHDENVRERIRETLAAL